MKQFFYTLLILGLIYFCYWYITRTPDIVSVNGKLTILSQKSEDDLFIASVQGTATNTGEINAKDIWIVYKIGNEEVTAYLSELKPKQTLKFRTGISRTKYKEPAVNLVYVNYNK